VIVFFTWIDTGSAAAAATAFLLTKTMTVTGALNMTSVVYKQLWTPAGFSPCPTHTKMHYMHAHMQ